MEVEIVGESHYQDTLRRLSKQVGGQAFPLTLRAEPSNQYDRNAVAVVVEGKMVGYLARDMAAVWQPMVMSQGGEVPGSGQLFGGTRDKPTFGVFGSAE